MKDKIQIIAFPVSDLTMARYLSAKACDYLAFDLRESNNNRLAPAQIKQIRDWVEGPKCIAYCDDVYQIDMLDFKELFDGFIIKASLESPLDRNYIWIGDITNLLEWSNTYDYYLTFNAALQSNIPRCFSIIQEDSFPALVLLPVGAEEKTGLFDFEAIDALFEKIEEM